MGHPLAGSCVALNIIRSIDHDQPQKNFKYIWLEFDLLLRIKAHFTLQETKKPAHHRLKIAGAAGSELSISYPPLRNASGSFVWPQIMLEACSIDGGGLLLRLRYHTHGVRQDLCISG